MFSTKIWGVTDEECRIEYPCDEIMADSDDDYYRGITIYASAPIVFKWLCQMRVAPYSYDWIDNLGRQSPQTLTPGLENIEIGQVIMYIFEIVGFETDRHLTVRIKRKNFGIKTRGDGVLSYLILPVNETECRLLVKIRVKFPGKISGLLWDLILPPGDLIMMRRQLLNFKRLAERMGKEG